MMQTDLYFDYTLSFNSSAYIYSLFHAFFVGVFMRTQYPGVDLQAPLMKMRLQSLILPTRRAYDG